MKNEFNLKGFVTRSFIIIAVVLVASIAGHMYFNSLKSLWSEENNSPKSLWTENGSITFWTDGEKYTIELQECVLVIKSKNGEWSPQGIHLPIYAGVYWNGETLTIISLSGEASAVNVSTRETKRLYVNYDVANNDLSNFTYCNNGERLRIRNISKEKLIMDAFGSALQVSYKEKIVDVYGIAVPSITMDEFSKL